MGEAIDPMYPVFAEGKIPVEKEDMDAVSPVKGFWRLPPEIRNAIYEELLVTDCAFRLGYVLRTWTFRKGSSED